MIEKIIITDSDGTQIDYYTYNSKGGLIKTKSMRDNKEIIKTIYTITEYDKKGNWTSREYKDEDGKCCIESRIIKYWE